MERLRISDAPTDTRYVGRRVGEKDAAPAAPAAPDAAQAEIQQSLAQAFVINQSSAYPMYSADEGLRRGTMFASLYKPFAGGMRCETR